MQDFVDRVDAYVAQGPGEQPEDKMLGNAFTERKVSERPEGIRKVQTERVQNSEGFPKGPRSVFPGVCQMRSCTLLFKVFKKNPNPTTGHFFTLPAL